MPTRRCAPAMSTRAGRSTITCAGTRKSRRVAPARNSRIRTRCRRKLRRLALGRRAHGPRELRTAEEERVNDDVARIDRRRTGRRRIRLAVAKLPPPPPMDDQAKAAAEEKKAKDAAAAEAAK